jgi:signal transduction histidine kinase
MPRDPEAPRSERDQTDESLRVERERADDAVGERVAAIDELADAVITRARARADKLLRESRANTDRIATSSASSSLLREERAREDTTVRRERAVADEVVREERLMKAGLLTVEREDTDQDLLTERAQSDVALATRDEFLGVVSHELRNMLTTIVGYADLIGMLVSREDHVADVLKHARHIQRSGARMDRLIGDLVDVASIEAGKLTVRPELGDANELATEAAETFQAQAAAAGVSLVAELAAPAPLVAFDPARMLQVLTNFLGNAFKFTPPGGRIEIRTERVGEEVRFIVSDTGVGIPGDKLEAVFQRFLQLPDHTSRGHGLGLYISKCIVDGHGGRIWVESTPGSGSRFCVALPIAGTVRSAS